MPEKTKKPKRPPIKIPRGQPGKHHSFVAQAQDPHAKRKTILRFFVLAIGLALVVALMVDLSRMEEKGQEGENTLKNELQELVLGLVGKPYASPDGSFSVVPPAGWKRLVPDEGSSYTVQFNSPLGPELGIITKKVEDDSFSALLKLVDEKERRLGIPMNLEVSRFNEFKATRRTANLQSLRVVAYDFVSDGYSHHIQFSAHPDVFDRYLPVIEDLLETYEPFEAGAFR